LSPALLLQKAAGGGDEEYPDLPADAGSTSHYDKDVAAAHLDAGIVGRQFHRGSGDRHFVRLDSYPAFEGYSLEVCLRISGSSSSSSHWQAWINKSALVQPEMCGSCEGVVCEGRHLTRVTVVAAVVALLCLQ
jgi:hypothetical protein